MWLQILGLKDGTCEHLIKYGRHKEWIWAVQQSDEKRRFEQVWITEDIQARLETLEKSATIALVFPPRPVLSPSSCPLSSTPFINYPQVSTASPPLLLPRTTRIFLTNVPNVNVNKEQQAPLFEEQHRSSIPNLPPKPSSFSPKLIFQKIAHPGLLQMTLYRALQQVHRCHLRVHLRGLAYFIPKLCQFSNILPAYRYHINIQDNSLIQTTYWTPQLHLKNPKV